MSFLNGATELPAAVINHTGTMLRFTRTQRPQLPTTNMNVPVHMPDGQVVSGIFTSTAAFPYVRGPEVRAWIRSWLRDGETRKVMVRARPRGAIEIVFATPGAILAPDDRVRAKRRIKRFAADRTRTRLSYKRWERDPTLRRTVLEVWGGDCQVSRCRLTTSAGYLSNRLTDVHHLRSVSGGGDDSPLNLCVLCVLHHALIHRGPTTSVVDSSLSRATIAVNGLRLLVRRDVRALMAAIGG